MACSNRRSTPEPLSCFRGRINSTETGPGESPIRTDTFGTLRLASRMWRRRRYNAGRPSRRAPSAHLIKAGPETGDGVMMMATPSPDYEGPKHHREHCDAAREWSKVPWVVDGVLVYVDDVQKHYERAKEAGANILSAPETGSHGTLYRVEDVEGHRWMFMQRPVM